MSTKPKFVIFAHNATYDKLHQVATLGMTAAAMGKDVIVVLLFWLALLYLAPPLAVLLWPWHGDAAAGALGAAAWALSAATFVPTLALYGRPAAAALGLPLAGILYAAMTIDSARRHRRARGATWKGRSGAGAH